MSVPNVHDFSDSSSPILHDVLQLPPEVSQAELVPEVPSSSEEGVSHLPEMQQISLEEISDASASVPLQLWLAPQTLPPCSEHDSKTFCSSQQINIPLEQSNPGILFPPAWEQSIMDIQ